MIAMLSNHLLKVEPKESPLKERKDKSMKSKLFALLAVFVMLALIAPAAFAQQANDATFTVTNTTGDDYSYIIFDPTYTSTAASLHAGKTATVVGPAGRWGYHLIRTDGKRISGHVTIEANGKAEITIDVAVLPTATVTIIPPPPTTYTVQPGEWLLKIARKLGVDANDLAKVNGLSGGDLIHPGDVLLLP